MNNQIFKYIKYLSYALLGLGVVVLVYFLIASASRTQISTEPGFPFSEGSISGTNVMLIYTYILFALAIFVALLFPIINIIKNPKGSMRSLMGLLIMVVVLVVSFLFSSAETIVTPVDTFDNPVTLRLSDTGLYATYIILVAAFAVILFGELKNAFKK